MLQETSANFFSSNISEFKSQSILNSLAKTAISCYKVIFQAHTSSSWNSSIGQSLQPYSVVVLVSVSVHLFLIYHSLPSPLHHCSASVSFPGSLLLSEVICTALYIMMHFFYHSDGPKIAIIMMTIIIQSKIPSFVLRHLASYMLANYPKCSRNQCF